MVKLINDQEYLTKILDSGSNEAKKIASKVIKEVFSVTGLNN